jgi:hypothetical protein
MVYGQNVTFIPRPLIKGQVNKETLQARTNPVRIRASSAGNGQTTLTLPASQVLNQNELESLCLKSRPALNVHQGAAGRGLEDWT